MKYIKLNIDHAKELITLSAPEQNKIIQELTDFQKQIKTKKNTNPATLEPLTRIILDTNFTTNTFARRLKPTTIHRTQTQDISHIWRKLRQGTVIDQNPNQPSFLTVESPEGNIITVQQSVLDLNKVTNRVKWLNPLTYTSPQLYKLFYKKFYFWVIARKNNNSLKTAIDFQSFVIQNTDLINRIKIELFEKDIPEKHWLWHIDFDDITHEPILLDAPSSDHTTDIYAHKDNTFPPKTQNK